MPHVTEQNITFAVRKGVLRHDEKRKNRFSPVQGSQHL